MTTTTGGTADFPIDALRAWVEGLIAGQICAPAGSSCSAEEVSYDSGTLFDYLKTSVGRVVASVSVLRGLNSATNQQAITQGYYAPGDGGHGQYYVDTADTVSLDNGGTVIVAADGARWKLASTANINVRQFGATGNSTTIDTSYVLAAQNAGLPLVFPSGTYNLGSITFTSAVTIIDGAMLKSTGSSVLAFNGGFKAPIAQVFAFSGTARATFDYSKTYQGYSEWWGAKAGISTFDNTPAFNAALIALREVGMLPVQYFINDTIRMQLDHRRLFGAGKSWTSVGGTQIISNSPSATIIKMGLDTNPGSVNGNLQHLRIDSFTTNRNVALLDSNSSCYGVDASWVLFGYATDVESINSKVGFYSSGNVQLFKTRCYSFRHLLGTVPANDSFHGYLYNGNSGLALAGGNGSMYDRDCTANCALSFAQLPTNVGFAMDGKPADYFSFGCEVTSCRQAVFFNGSGTVAGDADIRIDGLVADGIGLDGIFIQNIQGSIRITNSYAAPSGAATSFTGLRALNSSGISEDGNQWICWPAANSCGISFTNISSSHIGEGTMIRDAARPIEIHGSTACSVKAAVRNTIVSCTQGALLFDAGTNRCDFAISLVGDVAGRFAYGYCSPDATPSYNKLDWSKMTVTSFPSGDPARRLRYSGTNLGTTVGALPSGNYSVGAAA
ncbi:hypothetical protein [Pseudomonas saponiphila]|uniref:hypothetical protein n=1 Tax=Pseudomonas saponiphila TaxID=556534 RepID=UPI002240C217|nr:hypothetical protein [Pseudomonas saponiphila]